MNWGDTVYFFKGNEYLRYDKKTSKPAARPKLIEYGWPNLWGTSTTGWDGGYTPIDDSPWPPPE